MPSALVSRSGATEPRLQAGSPSLHRRSTAAPPQPGRSPARKGAMSERQLRAARCVRPIPGHPRWRAAMLSSWAASRWLPRLRRRCTDRVGAESLPEADTTRSDGREGSGTHAARPCAMKPSRSLAARGVRWKVSTQRSSRQRLTLMNPCAGRHVARRPTPRSSMTMCRPRTAGSSWSLVFAATNPLSRERGGHASSTSLAATPVRARPDALATSSSSAIASCSTVMRWPEAARGG